MTAYATTRRVVVTMALAALLVLGVVPTALAQTDERHGWERTSTATGRPDGGQVTQSSGVDVPVDGLRGWEATGAATGTRVATSNDRPVTTSPTPSIPSSTLLYGAAIVGALAIAFGAARLLRSPRGRVA